MLSAQRIATVPEPVHTSVRPEVIDVPVRPHGSPHVVSDSGPQASRTQRSPDINVESRLKPYRAELSDLNSQRHRAEEDESVRTSFRRQASLKDILRIGHSDHC